MKIRIRWTPKEDATILKEVQKYPTNLHFAFKEASKNLENRSFRSIDQRYYTQLKKKYNHIITTGSCNGLSNNTKNQKVDENGELTEQHLEPAYQVMTQMLNLSEADRKRLIAFFSK